MLTPAQRQTLKSHILATPDLNTFVEDSVWSAITDLLNTTSSPTFTVWRTSVSWDEIMMNGMDFTRVDNLQNGNKWRIWEWMFKNSDNSINPSKPNIRAGIDATWIGTAPDLAVRASVYTHCKRSATRLEKLFSVGVGSDAAPANLGDGDGVVIQGVIGFMEIQAAMTE